MLNNIVGGSWKNKKRLKSLSSREKMFKKGGRNVEKPLLYQCLDHLSFSKPNGDHNIQPKRFSAIIDQRVYQLTRKSLPVAANSCITTFSIHLFVETVKLAVSEFWVIHGRSPPKSFICLMMTHLAENILWFSVLCLNSPQLGESGLRQQKERGRFFCSITSLVLFFYGFPF